MWLWLLSPTGVFDIPALVCKRVWALHNPTISMNTWSSSYPDPLHERWNTWTFYKPVEAWNVLTASRSHWQQSRSSTCKYLHAPTTKSSRHKDGIVMATRDKYCAALMLISPREIRNVNILGWRAWLVWPVFSSTTRLPYVASWSRSDASLWASHEHTWPHRDNRWVSVNTRTGKWVCTSDTHRVRVRS